MGVGVALLGMAAIPALIVAGRPIARVAIKSGILFLEKGREVMAVATESLDDLVAEVQSELVIKQNDMPAHTEESESQ